MHQKDVLLPSLRPKVLPSSLMLMSWLRNLSHIRSRKAVFLTNTDLPRSSVNDMGPSDKWLQEALLVKRRSSGSAIFLSELRVLLSLIVLRLETPTKQAFGIRVAGSHWEGNPANSSVAFPRSTMKGDPSRVEKEKAISCLCNLGAKNMHMAAPH